MDKLKKMSKSMKIYILVLAFTALGAGLSNGVLSNYFKDVYDVTPFQRGLIEFPRELPGVFALFVIGIFSAYSDIKIAVIAQVLTVSGIIVLGIFTPPFEIMLIFIFINSLGAHMTMPLRDSIGMDLTEGKEIGKRMGQYKGVYTGFTMIASLLVYVGFKTSVFSFKTEIKWIFIVSASLLFLVLLLYLKLNQTVDHKITAQRKVKFVFRHEYRYYYVLTVMFGVQKQIMMVYGPWVLIDILLKGPETISILKIIGAFIGIFFIPALGRWTDRFGVKKLLFADAISFIGVYILYGFLAGGFASGSLATVGLPVLLAYGMFIIDQMSTQMSLIRTLYLKSILVEEADFRSSLAFGLSLDHVVSITCAIAAGWVWGQFGPQYIFFTAAALSLVNLYVAFKVKEPTRT